MSEPELRTERTVLRPVTPDDVEAIHELWTHPEVRRFLFDGRCVSIEESRSFLEASRAAFRERGYGLWVAFAGSGGAPVGFAGLLHSTAGPPNLIFGTRPGSWGQGLATELGRAVITYGFDALGLPEIVADVDEPNVPSVRVLEKLGMTLARRAVVDGRPLLYYRHSRSDGGG